VLSDPQERHRYDTLRSGGFGGGPGGLGGGDRGWADAVGRAAGAAVGASGGGSRRPKVADETFYGLGDFFTDLESDLARVEAVAQRRAEAARRRAKAAGATGTADGRRAGESARDDAVRGLWAELGALGEEFVSFLEQESGTARPSKGSSRWEETPPVPADVKAGVGSGVGASRVGGVRSPGSGARRDPDPPSASSTSRGPRDSSSPPQPTRRSPPPPPTDPSLPTSRPAAAPIPWGVPRPVSSADVEDDLAALRRARDARRGGGRGG